MSKQAHWYCSGHRGGGYQRTTVGCVGEAHWYRRTESQSLIFLLRSQLGFNCSSISLTVNTHLWYAANRGEYLNMDSVWRPPPVQAPICRAYSVKGSVCLLCSNKTFRWPLDQSPVVLANTPSGMQRGENATVWKSVTIKLLNWQWSNCVHYIVCVYGTAELQIMVM